MANPVTYAEQDLGVHVEHQKANDLLDQLAERRGQLASASSKVRFAREALADREAELTAEARSHREVTATDFPRYLKTVLHGDVEYQHRRSELQSAQDAQDTIEHEVRVTDRRLDVTVARLHELGGLLYFYGAVRSQPRS